MPPPDSNHIWKRKYSFQSYSKKLNGGFVATTTLTPSTGLEPIARSLTATDLLKNRSPFGCFSRVRPLPSTPCYVWITTCRMTGVINVHLHAQDHIGFVGHGRCSAPGLRGSIHVARDWAPDDIDRTRHHGIRPFHVLCMASATLCPDWFRRRPSFGSNICQSP